MATPTAIVAYLALFAGTGFLFLFVNLLVGRLVRPTVPNEEKYEVYECGEPTIGSSFVQFDFRFYVVALLFIIFDVEVAFFFPWATVFGKATQLSTGDAPAAVARLNEMGITNTTGAADGALSESARQLALISLTDIAVFFGVLMVGFAYVWKRGDLDWVRSMTRQDAEPLHRPPPARPLEPSASILSA